MLDDIDYSDLTSSAPAEAKPAKKSTINERRMSDKSKDKPTPKPIDTEALAEKAGQLEAQMGSPEINDPLVQYGLPGMGVLGGLAAAYGLYQASKNKPPAPGPIPPTPPAGPDYNAYNSPAYLRNPPQAPVAAPVAPEAPALPQQTNLTPEDIQARAAALKAPVAPSATPTVAELDAAFAAQNPISTPLSAAPIDAPAPIPSAAPNSPVTSVVVDELKEMIQEDVTKPVAPPGELRTGTGKPAFAGQGPAAALNKSGQPKLKPEYPGMEAVPSGMAFVPNAQYIDTMRQNIGQPDYTSIFTQRDFPLTNEMAIEQSKEINRSLGRATRAEAKAAGLPPAEITPGITKKTSAGTKPVRVAGTVGALMAISDLAKAETPGQRGMAGANLLEAVLPPGFMMSGAGEGSDMPPRARDPRMANINMTNASMFAPVSNPLLTGSPYAQSELAKKLRQEQEYVRKIGAGRGIAPPSAYQR